VKRHAVSNNPEVIHMAPPRKKRRAAGEGHPVHLRLPQDVFERIEAKTKKLGWPFNRTIINELAAFPELEANPKHRELNSAAEVILAKYGARIEWLDLSHELLGAVDLVLRSHGASRDAAIDQLSVTRNAMLKHKQATKSDQ
jgi:hypothetical protein